MNIDVKKIKKISGKDIQSDQKRIKEGFLGQRMIVLPPNVEKRIISNPVVSNLYLTAIGHYPNASCHDRERKNGSKQYILIYCTSGEGHIWLQNEYFDIYPNNYFIIPRNTPHRYRSAESKPWTIYWAHFDGRLAEHLYKRSLINELPQVHLLAYDEERIKLFEHIYSLLEHSYNEKDMEIVNISLYYFLSSIIYYKETNPDIFDNDSVGNSVRYMKQNLQKKLGISELAGQQNLSASHYIKLFKQKTGLSPIYYFNQLKIQNSCQYLYFTDKSIKEICVALGFEDPYYFSRLFRKLMGMSPSKYKKVYKK